MQHRYLVRSFVCLIAIVAALSLAMGQSSLRPRAKTPPVRLAAGDEPGAVTQPVPSRGSDTELLVGELTCFPDPFGTETRVTFVAHGTIELMTGGMGDVIGRVLSAPEDPCPAINAAAVSAVQELGCVTGPVGTETLTFVCHDRRERMIEVMATVSEGVLTAGM